MLHNHHLSSGAGTIGDAPSGLSLTPPQETKRNYRCTSAANAVCKSTDSFKNSRLNKKQP
jgi:hypothetical protein